MMFRGCSSLTSATLPNSLTTIGDIAFRSCDNLISITISCSVTSIGSLAFSTIYSYHSKLAEVVNLSSTPQAIGSDVFSGLTLSNFELRVPFIELAAYKAADVWKDFGKITAAEEEVVALLDSLAVFRTSTALLNAALAGLAAYTADTANLNTKIAGLEAQKTDMVRLTNNLTLTVKNTMQLIAIALTVRDTVLVKS